VTVEQKPEEVAAGRTPWSLRTPIRAWRS